MKALLTFLFAVIFSASQWVVIYAQDAEDSVDVAQLIGDAENFTDANGKKQGKWIHFGREQPEKGFPDDGKISEGTYKDDRKNGRWIMYFNDGMTPKTEGEFRNNRPNGPFIHYHPNGAIREKGTFSKQRYSDSLMRYNEKGIVVYEASYNEAGKEAGKVIYRHDNGKVEFEYSAVNGIPTGEAVRYWPNGDVKERIVYSADGSVQETSGEIEMVNPAEKVETPENVKKAPKPEQKTNFKPNDYNKLLNDNMEIWMEGLFKDGLLWDGRLYIYDEDGLLFKVEVYKNGIYISDGQL